MDELAVTRQRPVGLAVADAHLGRTVKEVIVGHIQVDAVGKHPVIELGNLIELIPLRVVETLVVGVLGRSANVARIRSVVLEAIHACAFEECLNLIEIFKSPVAAQAWRTAENGSTAFACGRVDYVDVVANPSAGKQCVATHLDAARVGIIDQFLDASYVLFGDIFGIGTRTEA